MTNVTEALRAHAACRERLAEKLSSETFHAPFFCELAPDHDCPMVQFLNQHDGDPALAAELTQARTAHAALHCIAIEIADLRRQGEHIDATAEFSSNGRLGMAATALIDAVWRLEYKSHDIAA